MAAGLAGSCLSLVVVALAPGNEVRQGFFATHGGLLSTPRVALYYATGHVPFTAYLAPATTLLTLVMPAVAGFYLCAGEPRRAKALELRAARRLLKERGVLEQTVAAVDDVEARFGAARTEPHIEREPENWKNRCVARFYGINSIRAR